MSPTSSPGGMRAAIVLVVVLLVAVIFLVAHPSRTTTTVGGTVPAPSAPDAGAAPGPRPAAAQREAVETPAAPLPAAPSSAVQLDPVQLDRDETRRATDPGTGIRLSVRVIDQDGRAAAHTLLWLTRRLASTGDDRPASYFQLGDGAAAFARQRTDQDGRAAFEGLPPGAWWLGPGIADPELAADNGEPRASADDIAAVAQRLELFEREPEPELTLEVDRGLFLRGRLFDAAGVAVGAAFVGCEHETVGGFVTGDVREDGTFELGPVASGVSLVRAIPRGRYVAPEPARCEPDGRELWITLVLGARLSGQVVDATTGAPARADVVCSRADEPFSPHGSFGDDGAFQFSGLAAGTYAVVARTLDGRSGWVSGLELAQGGACEHVRVELHAAARLSLRSTGGPERIPFTVRIGPALVASGQLDRGVPSTWFVPEGQPRIELGRESATSRVRTVEARASEVCEVDFELDAGDGMPAAGR